MDDPKMTKFKAMILDEKEAIIEQSAQGALRAREEMIVVKVAKSPQVALVQDKSYPEAQDAWERVLLMI
jgi:hypothetical protein